MTSMASAPGAGSHISPLITVFNALHMTGLVLLLAVTLTAWLAPTVKRSPAWYNVIISWIISSSSSLLLVGQQTGTIPSFGLCLFQAMLLYAAPAMNACVCLCFALEIFFGVFCAATQSRTPSGCKVLTVSLPYVTAFLVCIEVLTIGLIDEGLVARHAIGMYWHAITPASSIVTGFIVLLVMAWVFPVVAIVVFMFVCNWHNFRALCGEGNGRAPRSMMIRFGAFCILLPLPIATVILYSIPDPGSASLAIVTATVPIMIALIFGTQWDILHVWMFWRQHAKPPCPLPPVKPLAAPLPGEESESDIKLKPGGLSSV